MNKNTPLNQNYICSISADGVQKGLDHFKAYVHSAVFTHNLVVLTQRLAPG